MLNTGELQTGTPQTQGKQSTQLSMAGGNCMLFFFFAHKNLLV